MVSSPEITETFSTEKVSGLLYLFLLTAFARLDTPSITNTIATQRRPGTIFIVSNFSFEQKEIFYLLEACKLQSNFGPSWNT